MKVVMRIVKIFLETCCEGENHQIEAICRSIFPLSSIVATLEDKDIAQIDKGPYLHFMLSSYLITASSAIEIGADKLATELSNVFKALRQIAEKEIDHYFKGNNTSITRSQSEFVYDFFIPVLARLARRHFPF